MTLIWTNPTASFGIAGMCYMATYGTEYKKDIYH